MKFRIGVIHISFIFLTLIFITGKLYRVKLYKQWPKIQNVIQNSCILFSKQPMVRSIIAFTVLMSSIINCSKDFKFHPLAFRSHFTTFYVVAMKICEFFNLLSKFLTDSSVHTFYIIFWHILCKRNFDVKLEI